MRRRGLTLLELLVVLTILISLATIIVPVIGTFGRKSQQTATRENLLRIQELLVNQYRADMQDDAGRGEMPRPNLVKFPSSGRQNHPQLRYLFVNPDTEDITATTGTTLLSTRHWNGPYVRLAGARYQLDAANNFTNAYGLGDVTTGTPPVITSPGDPTILDAWGRPIVIQEPSTHGEFTPDATDKTYTRLISAGPNGKIDTLPTVLMPNKADRGDDVVIFVFRDDKYGDDFLKLEQ
jgi:prepilin-type N-terminal cleavage/methylation domain-containing protein